MADVARHPDLVAAYADRLDYVDVAAVDLEATVGSFLLMLRSEVEYLWVVLRFWRRGGRDRV
jgi:hypothetical protein